MPGERDAENLRVALMSYDDRELRIRKFYLEEQSTIIRCTCFQSGEAGPAGAAAGAVL